MLINWTPIKLSTKWERYHVTKTFPFLPEGFGTARIFSGETFWLDGLQLEVGQEPTEFKRVNQAELVLEAGNFLGLSVEDEPFSIKAAAYGEIPEGSVLQGNYLDSYGNEVPISGLPNQSMNGEVMTLNLPEHPSSKYGTFQLALRLHDAEGEAISDWAEVLLHRVKEPRMWGKDAPDSPFGVHIHADEKWSKLAKQLGFNWARAHGGTNLGKWYMVETQQGIFDFSDSDQQVEDLRNQDLMILGMVDTTPVWYGKGKDRERFHDAYYIPKDEYLENWSDYVKRVVERYKDEIQHWEIWNEPYVKSFFRLHDTDGGKYVSGTAADYQRILEPAYAAVKEANPDATVIWSSAHSEFWYAGTAEQGAYNFADEASFHFYSSGSPFPDFDKIMENMRSVMPEEKRSIRISNTEGGTGGANDLSLYRYIDAKPATSENTYQHAEYMVLYQLASVVHDVERFFLYTLHAWTWAAGWDIMMPDGSLPPSATAMSTLFWHVEGKEFREDVDLGTHVAYVFDGKGEDSIVLKRKPGVGAASLKLPKLPKKAVYRDFFGNARDIPVLKQDAISYISYKNADKVLKVLKAE